MVVGKSDVADGGILRSIEAFFTKIVDSPTLRTLLVTSGEWIDEAFFVDVRSLTENEVQYLCCIEEHTSYEDLNKLLIGKSLEEELTEEEKVDKANMSKRIDNLASKGFVEKEKIMRRIKKKDYVTVEVNAVTITEKGKNARMYRNPTFLLDKLYTLIEENRELRKENRELREVYKLDKQ